MINKSILLKAIEERKAGIFPNFSYIELNQAVDLVTLEGFNIDEVCQMDSFELDQAYNSDDYDDCEDSDNYYICPVCGKKFSMEYDGERYEGYVGFCDCGKKFKVSCCGLDDAMDEDENLDQHEYIQSVINR